MPGSAAWFCEVGDLVLVIARLFQALNHPEIHIRLIVVACKGVVLPPVIKGRPLLDLQAVAAEMVRLQLEHFLHAVLPIRHGLAGEAEDQVQTEVAHARLAGQRDRLYRLSKAVGPADGPKLRIIGGLDPQRQPIHPRPADPFQQGQVYAVGVGLHGDLAVPGEMIVPLHRPQEGGNPLCPQNGGCAAANVDRVHDAAFRLRGRLLQVGGKCG